MATPPASKRGAGTVESAEVASTATAQGTTTDGGGEMAQAESASHSERLLLLAPRGPLVVEMQIQFDERPQYAAIDELLDKAIATVGDGEEPAWAKVVASPRFASGQFGNMPVAGAKRQQETIQQYDVNRDGRAQRRELAPWLSQDNANGQAFSVYAVREFSAQAKEEAPTFALMDQDGDWRISEAEMQQGPLRLRSRDANDDNIVTLADLRVQAEGEETARSRGGAPPRAYALNKLEIDSIWYALVELYGVGGGLDADSLGLTPRLFDELDVDDDGTIDQGEIAALLEARADLSLRANFTSNSGGASPATLELVATSEDLQQAGVRTSLEAGRMVVELGGLELEVVAMDVAGGNRRLNDLGAQFAMLDKDNSGLVDGEELEVFGARAGLDIEQIDQNDDLKLSLEEIREALRNQRVYAELQVQARTGSVEDSLFDWLDVDRDRRLSAREMRSAAGRLAELDRDGDAALIAPELPERYACVLLRGAAGNLRGLGPMVDVERVRGDMPPWLAAMDINGDGEVSRREFVGTPQQFGDLDVNGDGFVGASEIRAQAADEAADGNEPPQN